ncbi:hypothetical protein CEXT_57351 [Caerostris extrusa]|uniref:Uncharacterized protein n=1 Tax=Caerostris extrusa TaxID=172846 RepID=A0AAV4MDA2_CAEEX|nr:hypothetical protein CEXT_57351 [Caerostris extrusa]
MSIPSRSFSMKEKLFPSKRALEENLLSFLLEKEAVGIHTWGDNKIWWGDLFKMGGKVKGIKAESELITHGKGVNLFQMAMSNCLSVLCQPLHPSEERLGQE